MTEASPSDILAALPEAEQLEFLSKLTPAGAEALLYDWRGFHARPSQIAPAGDWSIWLALAGRGWGKTRVGSEWVREMVCGATPLAGGQARRVALVADWQSKLNREDRVPIDFCYHCGENVDDRPHTCPACRRPLSWLPQS